MAAANGFADRITFHPVDGPAGGTARKKWIWSWDPRGRPPISEVITSAFGCGYFSLPDARFLPQKDILTLRRLVTP
ncbi:MAG: hypothetical protein IPK19_18800 [Chloroflexi bacterium]|nr:hypothetical protein [Chloroflexota bacterium]